MVGPQRRTSSVASSCVSMELGDQDAQSSSPSTTTGLQLGKSPASAMASSPRTPAALEKSGSPSTIKKRRASIGGVEDLARGLDFGTTSGTISPSTEEKKHRFLTRGGGHKKIVSPSAVQTSSPVKKTVTPPGKEKLVTARATAAASTLSPRKSFEAKKDITSPRRSVLASELGASMNGSLVSEAASGLAEVTPKKASPRASLEGKVSAGKPSPRPSIKRVVSPKGRKNANGDSPPEAETKVSPAKTVDVKTRKSSPKSPAPASRSRPGLTPPKSQNSIKTRQHTPSQPARAKTRTDKAVRPRPEDSQAPEGDPNAVPVLSPEIETQAKSEGVDSKADEEGSALLPSLMVDGNVGDEDMSSLDQDGGPAGFDNDMWLSEDRPCMFSSLSRLPEPDDSSSSHLDDPPEFADHEPVADDVKQKFAESAKPDDVTVSAEGTPSEISKDGDPDWSYASSSVSHVEDSGDAEVASGLGDELESQQTLLSPAVVKLVDALHGERMPCMVPTHPDEEVSSSKNGSPGVQSAASEPSLPLTENDLTAKRNMEFLSEGLGKASVSSQSDEETVEVVTQVTEPKSIKSNGGVCHFDESSRALDASNPMSALHEEERWTAAEEEEFATQEQHTMSSSDDESSEDFIGGSCGAQLNLKQSFDAAAEPAAASHGENDGTRGVITRESREASCDMESDPSTNAALLPDGETLPKVTKGTESEFADECCGGQEPETYRQTHLDKDMMIFDFEEYWTHNAEDESGHSDAGQNDAEDLQPYCMRGAELASPLREDEASMSVPVNELPVSSLPGRELIRTELDSSAQLGGNHMDSQGWSHSNSMSTIPAANICQMDTQRDEHEEFDEVFHIFEGSGHVSSRYTTLEREHSSGLGIVHMGQNFDVPKGKDMELDAEVEEHQSSSLHPFATLQSPLAELYSPKPDSILSTETTRVDQDSLAQEDLATSPVLPVASKDLEFSAVTAPVPSQSKSFETAALPESYLSDDALEKDSENLSRAQLQEARAKTVETAQATETDESLPDECQDSLKRSVGSKLSGTEDACDLDSPPLDSSKLLIEEHDQSVRTPSADEKMNPLVSSIPAISLPPMNGISEEEQTEAIFLMSLESKEDSTHHNDDSAHNGYATHHNGDFSTDLEMLLNHSQGRNETIKDLDPALLNGSELISEPKEQSQVVSAESRESETEVPEHDNVHMVPRAMLAVAERAQVIQCQDDEIKRPALQMESFGETVAMAETPLMSTPETLQDDKETDCIFTEHELPTGVHDESHALSVSPVSDKFASTPEVNSTASQHEVDEGTCTMVHANVMDTALAAEMLEKDDANHSTAVTTPPVLSAGKVSSVDLYDADEFDEKLGSEVTVDEEKSKIATDFIEEQSGIVEPEWEEPLHAHDSNSSSKDKKDLLRQESMVTHAASSVESDDTKDLEIETDIFEISPRSSSTPASESNEAVECHDHIVQENHVPLGKSVPEEDQVSRSEDALENENILVASTDDSIDGSDDHSIKGVEIVPEHVSSQDLPLERFAASNLEISKAAISDGDKMDSTLARFQESERLEPIPLFTDEETVVESPRKSVIHSIQGIHVEGREESKASQVLVAPEMLTTDTFAPENILWMAPEQQYSSEDTVLEDEDTVVYSPRNSFVASGTPDTMILGASNVEAHSNVSSTPSKESFSGKLAEESLLNGALLNTANSDSHGIQAVPQKDGNEVLSLVEKPAHENEDTALASLEKFPATSGEGAGISSVTDGKDEEKSLTGGLERSEETNVENSNDHVVSSSMSQFSIPATETPETTISNEMYNNHWDESWNASQKGESLNAPVDSVATKHTVEESSIQDVGKEVDSPVEKIISLPDHDARNAAMLIVEEEEDEKDGEEGARLNGGLERESEPEVEKNSQISFATPGLSTAYHVSNFVVAGELVKQTDEKIMDQSPEEVSMPEVEKTVVGSWEESFIAPDAQNATDTSNLTAAAEREIETDKEELTLGQSLDTNSAIEVEKAVVEVSNETFVAPYLQNATSPADMVVTEKRQEHSDREEESLKQLLDTNSSFEVKETLVESPRKESFIAPDLVDATSASNSIVAEKLGKQGDKEETVDRSLEAKPMEEAEEIMEESSEPFDAPGLLDANDSSNVVVTNDLEKNIDREVETFNQSFEAKAVIEAEQTVTDDRTQIFVAPDSTNAKLSNMVVPDELEKQFDKEVGNVEEKPTLAAADVAMWTSKDPLVVVDVGAESLEAEDVHKHSPRKLPSKEVDSVDEITPEAECTQDTIIVISSDNVKSESARLAEVNDTTHSSSGLTNLAANSVAPKLDLAYKSAVEPHSGSYNADSVSTTLNVSEVVQKVTVAEALEEFHKAPAAVEASSMTNGEKLKDYHSPIHETTPQRSPVPTNPQAYITPESTSPRSPAATLYPLSKPPFSGSLQDRLWEEQAEAYNSGQGTPSRSEDHALQAKASGVPRSPNASPTSSEDQIQPVSAAAASNGNHALVMGSSNGAPGHEDYENGSAPVQNQLQGNGKEKLHTPLRSLLLEESRHAGTLTPNGVNSSPSFMRRLFRVMSSSRTAEKDASQAKLKRSSSKWVSCLGSPQVQQ